MYNSTSGASEVLQLLLLLMMYSIWVGLSVPSLTVCLYKIWSSASEQVSTVSMQL